MFLGTPAFSSPEQLRGDELDVRSDIYSVGVSLYYLLTGETPFHAKQMVQLLATVLERPAPSPSSLRAEVPPGLAKVVLRCLAKQSKDRFKNYDELRQALLPFTSQAPDPGTLGFRVLAYGIDSAVLNLVAALILLLWFKDIATWYLQFNAISDAGPQSTPELNRLAGVGMLLQWTYFSVLEGVWGTTAGKAICRLRVVGRDRQAARLPRSLVRSAIFLATGWIAWWALYAYDRQAGIAAIQVTNGTLFWTTASISIAAFLLLFCTVRRRNGFAGLHELASGTRVVRRQASEQRPALTLADEPLPDAQSAQQIGSYDVLGRLDADSTHELLLAYDTRLLRKVWIRVACEDEPPPTAELRELARIGRLRWLKGGCDNSGRWDAYEAPSGKPLLILIEDEAQPWEAVRFWLSDLADELSESLDHGPFPTALELDRVWITGDGRAKLLDFAAPGIGAEERVPEESPAADADAATISVFLKRVAIAALEGKVLSTEQVQGRNVSARIPVSARAFLSQLDRSENTTVPTAKSASLTRRPAAVSAERRGGALAACCLPMLMVALYMIPMSYAEKQFVTAHPDVGELSGFVEYYQSLGKWYSTTDGDQASTAELREAVEIHIADRFRSTIEDAQIWSDPLAGEFVNIDARRLVRGFLEAHRSSTPEEIAKANARIQPVQSVIREMGWTVDDYRAMTTPAVLMGMFCAVLIMFVVLPSLVSALILGESLLLRMLEIAIVTRGGAPASRLRVLWRNAVLWTLVLLAIALFIYLEGRLRLGYLMLIYGLSTMFTSERGLQDELAGTWLVPR